MQAVNGFFNFVHAVLGFYEWIVIAAVIFSWLFAFNILNHSSGAVRLISEAVYRLTEPVLYYIRRFFTPWAGWICLRLFCCLRLCSCVKS